MRIIINFSLLIAIIFTSACSPARVGAPNSNNEQSFRTSYLETNLLRSITSIQIKPIKLGTEARSLSANTKLYDDKLFSSADSLVDVDVHRESLGGRQAVLETTVHRYNQPSISRLGTNDFTRVYFTMDLISSTGQKIWSGNFNYTDQDLNRNWFSNSSQSELKKEVGWLSASTALSIGIDKAVEELSGVRQKVSLNQEVK